LNREKLAAAESQVSGTVALKNLTLMGIAASDAEAILTNLVERGILDNDGKVRDFDGNWDCPECPLFEDPVRNILWRKLAARKVCQAWISKDEVDTSVITALPVQPARRLLDDLIVARLILLPSVQGAQKTKIISTS
jgi:hypothetical protein